MNWQERSACDTRRRKQLEAILLSGCSNAAELMGIQAIHGIFVRKDSKSKQLYKTSFQSWINIKFHVIPDILNEFCGSRASKLKIYITETHNHLVGRDF